MLVTNFFLEITTEISGMRLSSWEIIWSSANIYRNGRKWANIFHTVLYMGLHKVYSKLYYVISNSSYGQNFDRYIVGLILFRMVPDAWKLLPKETFYSKKWRDSASGCKSSFASVGVHFYVSVYLSMCANCQSLYAVEISLPLLVRLKTVLCHIS